MYIFLDICVCNVYEKLKESPQNNTRSPAYIFVVPILLLICLSVARWNSIDYETSTPSHNFLGVPLGDIDPGVNYM